MPPLSRVYPELLDDPLLNKLKVDHPLDYRSKDERAKNPHRPDSEGDTHGNIDAKTLPETNGAPI